MESKFTFFGASSDDSSVVGDPKSKGCLHLDLFLHVDGPSILVVDLRNFSKGVASKGFVVAGISALDVVGGNRNRHDF